VRFPVGVIDRSLMHSSGLHPAPYSVGARGPVGRADHSPATRQYVAECCCDGDCGNYWIPVRSSWPRHRWQTCVILVFLLFSLLTVRLSESRSNIRPPSRVRTNDSRSSASDPLERPASLCFQPMPIFTF
jgi:hypothetical protein